MGKITERAEEVFLVVFESEHVCEVFREIRKQLPQMKGEKEFEYDEMEYDNKGCILIILKTANAKSKLENILKDMKDFRLINIHVLDALLKTTFEDFVNNISKNQTKKSK